MSTVQISNPIVPGGVVVNYPNAGTPIQYTNEVDAFTNDATGGTFIMTITFDTPGNGITYTTAAISATASAATLAAAINAAVDVNGNVLETVMGGSVVTGSGSALGSGTATMTYQNTVGGLTPTYTFNIAALTGGTNNIVQTVTTAAVLATGAGIVPAGGKLSDTNTGFVYTNDPVLGNQSSPVWAPSGLFVHSGAPAASVNQTDSLAQTGGSGTWAATITINGGPNIILTGLSATITAAQLQTAVRAAAVAAGYTGFTGFTAAGGALGTYAITTVWSGPALNAVITWTINNTGMSGGTVVNTPATVGAVGTFQGVAMKGSNLTDYTNAEAYMMTGTQATVAWTKIKSLS